MLEKIKNLMEIHNELLYEVDSSFTDDLKETIDNMLDEFEDTINCPSNWREIKEDLQNEGYDWDFRF